MDRLKKKLAVRRGLNTKLINELTTALQSATIDVSCLGNLRDRRLASNDELRKVNEEIEPLIPDNELEEEYAAVVDFEDEAAKIVSEVRAKTAGHPPIAQTSQTTRGGNKGNGSQGIMVKLPKLQLLQFQGELTQWQPFWEQFDAAIHRNTSLCDAEKFQYLRSLLVGLYVAPAASAISGLQATAACYRDAVEILAERFGDKRPTEYLGGLRNLPAVKYESDVRGLRYAYDHVQTNIRGLRALGVSSATYATMMVDILLSTLPANSVVEYHRFTSYGTWFGVPHPTEEGALTTDDGARSDPGR